MAQDEVQIKISLDTNEAVKGFAKIEKEADKVGKKTQSGFSQAVGDISSDISSLATRFGPVGLAAAAAIKVIKEVAGAALDFALLGEKTQAVEVQFNSLSASAGIASESLKQGLIDATKGLIDDEDALQIATKSIVALGAEAQRLPEILTLARNASKALGKDFQDSFGQLSSFVETGNARVLRQFGIVLDLDGAYKKAAQSIGVLSSELTEQQKQTVRLNLLLTEQAGKFNNSAQSITPLKDAFDRLKVSIGNTSESLATSFSELVTRSFIDNDDLSNVALPRIQLQAKEAAASIQLLTQRIKENQSFDSNGNPETNRYLDLLNEKLNSAKERAELLNVELAGRSDADLFAALDASRNKPQETKIERTDEQEKAIFEKRKAQRLEFDKFIQSQNQLQAQSELTRAQEAFAASQTEENLAIVTRAQELAEQQKFLLDKQNLDKFYKDNELLSDVQRQIGREELEASHEARMTAIKKKSEEDRLRIQKQSANLQFNNFQSSLNTIATLQQSSSKELIAIGKAAAITTATIDGYAAVQKALASAPPPFNFAIAALVGTAAAANIAKIASTGGGGGGGGSISAPSGGGIAATPSSTTELAQTTELERPEAGTQVSLVIQGNVLDSDESGSRIVDLINQAFDKKGVVINQGVMA